MSMPTSPPTFPPPPGPPVRPRFIGGFSEPGESAPQISTRVHAHATIVAFALFTLSRGAFAWFARARTNAWTDAVHFRATVAAARHADHLYILAGRSTWLALGLGAVAVSVWSGRVVANARARGMRVSPAKARWMWYIPVFGIVPSIRELRKAVSGTDYSTHHLDRWLMTGYVLTAMQVFFILAIGTIHTSTPEALAALGREALFALLLFFAYVFFTVVSALAILHTDTALTLRRR